MAIYKGNTIISGVTDLSEKIKVVDVLPENPLPDVLYFVKE